MPTTIPGPTAPAALQRIRWILDPVGYMRTQGQRRGPGGLRPRHRGHHPGAHQRLAGGGGEGDAPADAADHDAHHPAGGVRPGSGGTGPGTGSAAQPAPGDELHAAHLGGAVSPQAAGGLRPLEPGGPHAPHGRADRCPDVRGDRGAARHRRRQRNRCALAAGERQRCAGGGAGQPGAAR